MLFRSIRRYLPELKNVGPQWIHEPWRQETPPETYARPIVDHKTAIAYARQEIGKRWKGEGFRDAARQVVKKLGSRSKPIGRKAAKPKSKQMELDL